jgi:dipeptidase
MKTICVYIVSFITLTLLNAQEFNNDFNCSTVIVGRNASESGFVMVGHNEDDGGRQIVNFYKVAFRDYEKDDVVRFKDGAVEQQDSHSYSYLWLEMPGQDFADSYMNQNGVLITSNSCPSKEQYGEIVDGGIGFDLRRLIAERALSARYGVELAGRLVEKWGYNASGRTYTIADKNEAWLFAVVRGKNWVAERVPDDNVAFIPNYYTIRKINLEDNDNFLASHDLIGYAQRRGWYDPDKDSIFDFSAVYASDRALTSMANKGRMWVGVNQLSGKNYKVDDSFPFSFTPKHKISMKEMYTVLSNHYEGTGLDDSDGYKNGSPHSNKTQCICASTQQLSFVAEMRSNLPWEIGGRIWIAPRRGCVNVYMPFYFGVTVIPESLTMDTPEMALKMHFQRPESIYERNDSMAWWNFVEVAEYTDQDYMGRIVERRNIKDRLQQSFLKEAEKLEKDYVPIYKKQPEVAAKMIDDFEKDVLSRTLEENNKYLGK